MSKTFRYRKHFCFFACLSIFLLAWQPGNCQPGAADPLIKKAKDHLNLFQYEQAQSLLNQATQLEPDNWEPWFLAGRAFMKQKKEVQAEKFLQKALQLNPNEIEVQKALGALYIFFAKEAQTAGKSAEMTDFMHKACKAYPGGTKIWQSLMENWWKAGAFEKIKQEGDLILRSNNAALETGDDKNLQTVLVIVAKAYYQEGDIVNTQRFIESASKIREHNDDLYAIKRDLKSKADESIRNLVEQANANFNKGEYDKALELLQKAKSTPGAKSDVADLMEKIEREAGLMKVLKELDTLIAAEKFEPALEKLEEASLAYPDEDRITSKLEQVRGRVDKIKADAAKARAELIASKRQKLDRKQQYEFFLKESAEQEGKHNYDVAIISLEKALKLFPDQESIKKRIEELTAKAKEAKALKDAFAVNLSGLEKLFNSGNYSDGYTEAKKMLAQYSADDISRKKIAVIHAEICLNLEKNDEAKKMLIDFEEDKDKQNLYYYIKGMVAYREGNRDEALETLKKVSSDFRSDIGSTIWWIYLYKYQAGLYIVMLILLFPAIRLAKDTLATWKTSRMLRKIEAIKETGKYEENLAFLEERYAREDTPNPKQIAVMLAEALLRTNNVQRSYEVASALLKKDNRNANARRIAGEACLQLQDTSPAGMDYIQGLLKIDGSRKPVVLFLAKTYMQSKADHKMAQDFIQEAIAFNPGDTEAIAYLADTYIKRQTYNQQTIKIFEKAIKAAPEVPDYYHGLIENYRKIDNPGEAERWLEAARAKFPDETMFNEAQRTKAVSSRATIPAKTGGGLPDYENIGNESDSAFPDYENIGNEPPAAGNAFAGGFPDYESIGEEPAVEPVNIKPAAPVKTAVQGPTKNCPHCNAINPAKEYYCTTCGKAFGG